jgi:hypothetical protein
MTRQYASLKPPTLEQSNFEHFFDQNKYSTLQAVQQYIYALSAFETSEQQTCVRSICASLPAFCCALWRLLRPRGSCGKSQT